MHVSYLSAALFLTFIVSSTNAMWRKPSGPPGPPGPPSISSAPVEQSPFEQALVPVTGEPLTIKSAMNQLVAMLKAKGAPIPDELSRQLNAIYVKAGDFSKKGLDKSATENEPVAPRLPIALLSKKPEDNVEALEAIYAAKVLLVGTLANMVTLFVPKFGDRSVEYAEIIELLSYVWQLNSHILEYFAEYPESAVAKAYKEQVETQFAMLKPLIETVTSVGEKRQKFVTRFGIKPKAYDSQLATVISDLFARMYKNPGISRDPKLQRILAQIEAEKAWIEAEKSKQILHVPPPQKFLPTGAVPIFPIPAPAHRVGTVQRVIAPPPMNPAIFNALSKKL